MSLCIAVQLLDVAQHGWFVLSYRSVRGVFILSINIKLLYVEP